MIFSKTEKMDESVELAIERLKDLSNLISGPRTPTIEDAVAVIRAILHGDIIPFKVAECNMTELITLIQTRRKEIEPLLLSSKISESCIITPSPDHFTKNTSFIISIETAKTIGEKMTNANISKIVDTLLTTLFDKNDFVVHAFLNAFTPNQLEEIAQELEDKQQSESSNEKKNKIQHIIGLVRAAKVRKRAPQGDKSRAGRGARPTRGGVPQSSHRM